jgi:hypothetical protein
LAFEEIIVSNILNISYVLGGIAAIWTFLTCFLIVRIMGLENQMKLLTATIEANMYKKR